MSANPPPQKVIDPEKLKIFGEALTQLAKLESDLAQKLASSEAGSKRREDLARELMSTVSAIQNVYEQRRVYLS